VKENSGRRQMEAIAGEVALSKYVGRESMYIL
jgi:hypothetical protein